MPAPRIFARYMASARLTRKITPTTANANTVLKESIAIKVYFNMNASFGGRGDKRSKIKVARLDFPEGIPPKFEH